MDREPIGVYVEHRFLGCECGCCGHVVFTVFDDGSETEADLRFTHPYGLDFKTWARWLSDRDHKKELPLLWDRCSVVDD